MFCVCVCERVISIEFKEAFTHGTGIWPEIKNRRFFFSLWQTYRMLIILILVFSPHNSFIWYDLFFAALLSATHGCLWWPAAAGSKYNLFPPNADRILIALIHEYIYVFPHCFYALWIAIGKRCWVIILSPQDRKERGKISNDNDVRKVEV